MMKMNVILSVCFVLLAFGAQSGIAKGSVTRPVMIPHRGMWKEKVPQNTVEAICRAYEAGALCVETDFHHTRHGQMVCIHTRKDLEKYTGSKKAKIDVFCPHCGSTVDAMTRADADAIRASGLDFRVYGVKSRDAFKQAAMLGASGFTTDCWHDAFKWVEELGVDYHPIVVSAAAK